MKRKPKKTAAATTTPAFLNERESARLLGISERKMAQLRHEPWFPKGIELGPRCTRWSAAELAQVLTELAPRVRVRSEPVSLLRAKVERMKGVA